MYYVRMAVGVVMCAIGGWQLVTVLNEGPGGGDDGEDSSGYSYRWTAKCDDVASRAFGSAPYSVTDIDRGMLRLRQQGCDVNAAPSGAIPMISDDGATADEAAPNDWGGQGGNQQMSGGDWGD